MIDWLTSFWDKNNNDLLLEVVKAGVIFSLGVFCRGIGKGILFFFKFIYKGSRTLLFKSKRWFRSISQKIKYKRLIKQIENKEVVLTDDFLRGKSPEKNPELKRIFEMMENGELEEPECYKLSKFLKDVKIDLSDIDISTRLPKPLKIPDPLEYLKDYHRDK